MFTGMSDKARLRINQAGVDIWNEIESLNRTNPEIPCSDQMKMIQVIRAMIEETLNQLEGESHKDDLSLFINRKGTKNDPCCAWMKGKIEDNYVQWVPGEKHFQGLIAARHFRSRHALAGVLYRYCPECGLKICE